MLDRRRCPPTVVRKTRCVRELVLDGVLLLLLNLKRLLALQILMLATMYFLLWLRCWRRTAAIGNTRNRYEIHRSGQIPPALGVILCPCLHIRVRIRVRWIVHKGRRARDRLLGLQLRLWLRLCLRLGFRFRLYLDLRLHLWLGLNLYIQQGLRRSGLGVTSRRGCLDNLGQKLGLDRLLLMVLGI